MAERHCTTLFHDEWHTVEATAIILQRIFPKGFSVPALQKKRLAGELPKGKCWITTGDAYAYNPQAIIDWVQEQNQTEA